MFHSPGYRSSGHTGGGVNRPNSSITHDRAGNVTAELRGQGRADAAVRSDAVAGQELMVSLDIARKGEGARHHSDFPERLDPRLKFAAHDLSGRDWVVPHHVRQATVQPDVLSGVTVANALHE